jgi:hypothetical protein
MTIAQDLKRHRRPPESGGRTQCISSMCALRSVKTISLEGDDKNLQNFILDIGVVLHT